MFMLSLEAGPGDENKEILVDQYEINIFFSMSPLVFLSISTHHTEQPLTYCIGSKDSM